MSGQRRQESRQELATKEFERAIRQISNGAMSVEEYEIYRAIEAVAARDLEIAKLKVDETALSLKMALGLARNGQRIPLCRRIKQSDENTVTALLKDTVKLSKPPPKMQLEPEITGTRIDLARAGEDSVSDPRPAAGFALPAAVSGGADPPTAAVLPGTAGVNLGDFDIVLPAKSGGGGAKPSAAPNPLPATR